VRCLFLRYASKERPQLPFPPPPPPPSPSAVVTSKLWNNFHRPELVKKGVQESLAKLKLQKLDLFLIHFPVSFRPDVTEATSPEEVEDVPLEATWRAMEALVDEGLATNIGVSNFEIEHLQRIQAIATKPIAVNQFETQPYYQRTPLVNYCQEHGIVVTAHTSLGSPGNVMKSHHASAPLMQDPVVAQIAADVGRAPANVLLRWAVQRGTIVLPKSVTAARIASNADIFSFELSAAQMAAINALDKPGLEGCFNHPKTPWLGRGDFKPGEMAHYYQ
jgi:diketogulonate reductase-like aldo/keto reductase